MTATTTTVPVAITELFEHLSDLDWPDRPSGITGDVEVILSSELRDQTREAIVIGGVNGDREATALGRCSIDESYTVNVFIVVAWPGDTALEVMERAWQMFAVVEAELFAMGSTRNPPDGILWHEISRPEGTPTTQDEGHGYVISFGVSFRSRIRPNH